MGLMDGSARHWYDTHVDSHGDVSEREKFVEWVDYFLRRDELFRPVFALHCVRGGQVPDPADD